MEKVEIGLATLYMGDCLEVIESIDPTAIDVLMTDPPYGMHLDTEFSKMANGDGFKGKLSGNDYEIVQGDHQDYDPTPILERFAGVKEQFWFGADYYSDHIPRKNDGSWLVWDKRLTESADKMFGSCFELVWSKRQRKRLVIRSKWAGIFGMEKQDTAKRVHPTQKPLGLMGRMVLDYTEKGQMILDPYMGSGTTGVAAVKEGRRFIGVEMSRKYFKIACRRIEREQQQLKMF